MKYYDYGACMNKDDTILQCVFLAYLNEKFVPYVDYHFQLHVFLFTLGQKVNFCRNSIT